MSEWLRSDVEGYRWIDVAAFARTHNVDHLTLPRSVRIVLETALRGAINGTLDLDECASIAGWRPGAASRGEWRFPVGRVLMQDASGIPLLADLAAMRDAVARRGGDPLRVDLAVPSALVIDHSIDANQWGNTRALAENMAA